MANATANADVDVTLLSWEKNVNVLAETDA